MTCRHTAAECFVCLDHLATTGFSVTMCSAFLCHVALRDGQRECFRGFFAYAHRKTQSPGEAAHEQNGLIQHAPSVHS